MAEDKISKEEKHNSDQLAKHYEATKNCPKCGIKLPIDSRDGCWFCG